MAVLSRQYGASTLIINRVLNKTRGKRILERTIEFIYDPSFDAPGAAEAILGPMPERPRTASEMPDRPLTSPDLKPPADVPAYVASLYAGAPLLSRQQETHLFRKMNYLKFRASRLRETLDPAHTLESLVDEIEQLLEQAVEIKNQIICANVRLVVSIVKRRVGSTSNFFEMVSDGNMSLIRAVERFDFSRGFKFSTYATWAIVNNFARNLPEEKRWRDRFVTGFQEVLASTASDRSDTHGYESDDRYNEKAVKVMLGQLTDRERRVLVSRYGIGGANELTLEQLGKELGITKERVRQIQSRAQDKLRKFARNKMIS